MRVGEWYELPDGRVVRVVEVSGDPEMVLAEGPSGGAVERPVANARLRWSRLPEDGLAVRLATMPGMVQQLAEEDPVGLAILAIKDLGGSGSTAEIKERLELAITDEDLDRWWKRNQPKLTKDERIDNVDALSKRYRLVTPGLGKPQRVREIRTGAMRAGRALLDGPTLKSSREKAKRRLRPGETPPTGLTDIATLVDDAGIDATDRFMAGEIGVFLGAFTETELGVRLGSDASEINLLRVPDHQSRDRALDLCQRVLTGRDGERPEVVWPTVASAIALGEPWSIRGVRIARDAGFDARSALAGGLGWATPGSPEAGEVDHPKDLQQYLARVSRLASPLDIPDAEGAGDLAVSVLAAMESLSTLSQKGDLWRDCITALAEVMWDVPTSGFDAVREAIQDHPPSDSEAWRAIVSQSPSGELPRLEPLLESAAVSAPASIGALEDLCAST